MNTLKREEIDRLAKEITKFLEKWGLNDCYALYYNQHAEDQDEFIENFKAHNHCYFHSYEDEFLIDPDSEEHILTLKFDSYLYDFFMEDMFTAKASDISKEAQQILESKLNIGTEVNPCLGGFFYNVEDLKEELSDEINDNPPPLDFADFDSMDEYNEFLDEVNHDESTYIAWNMKNHYGEDDDLQRRIRETIFEFVKQEFKELLTPYKLGYILDSTCGISLLQK